MSTPSLVQYAVEAVKERLEELVCRGDEPRVWACGLARGLAGWLRAFADEHDPPIREGEPNVGPASRTMNRAQFAAEVERATAQAFRGLSGVILCACQPNAAATFGDSRIDCMGPSASVICECACHPENRRYTGPIEVTLGFKAPAPFPPGPDIGPDGRNYDGRPYTDDPDHPLSPLDFTHAAHANLLADGAVVSVGTTASSFSAKTTPNIAHDSSTGFSLKTSGTYAGGGISIKACDCQPAGMVYSNLRCHCMKISEAGELCACRCHPENR
jgi:hypothetical protein